MRLLRNITKVTKYAADGTPYETWVEDQPKQLTREELWESWRESQRIEEERRAEMKRKYPNASASINLPSEQTLNDYYDRDLESLT